MADPFAGIDPTPELERARDAFNAIAMVTCLVTPDGVQAMNRGARQLMALAGPDAFHRKRFLSAFLKAAEAKGDGVGITLRQSATGIRVQIQHRVGG